MLPWEHVVTERLELRSSLGFSSPHLVPAPPADCTSARIRYSHHLHPIHYHHNRNQLKAEYWQPPFCDLMIFRSNQFQSSRASLTVIFFS